MRYLTSIVKLSTLIFSQLEVIQNQLKEESVKQQQLQGLLSEKNDVIRQLNERLFQQDDANKQQEQEGIAISTEDKKYRLRFSNFID